MLRLKTAPEIMSIEVLSKEVSAAPKDAFTNLVTLAYHHTFYYVHVQLKKFQTRFSQAVDHSIFNDMLLFYLLATKKYLDHRKPPHLFRLIVSAHFFQKKLLKATSLYPHLRHLEIRWLPTSLLFPFSTKSVLGCLVGFNLMDRHELFDEENILLVLRKHLPDLKLVNESFYCHTSQHKKLKIFYLEIEKSNGLSFSLLERSLLKTKLKEKIEKSIQTLSPSIFMGFNDEEIYKNVLVLSKEIQSLEDLPQVNITYDRQTGKEIIFRITLVQASPFHRFSLKERFVDAACVPQRTLIVRHLEDHPIEAHLFRLHLPCHISLLRSDGSLDFYSARKKVAALLMAAIGEFRDYNGGTIIKLQELLQSFKESVPEISNNDPELMETFFYSLTPLVKQILLDLETLVPLFLYYIENRKKQLPVGEYSFNTYHTEHRIFLIVHGNHTSLLEMITTFLQEQSFKAQEIAYNVVEHTEGVFFNCVFLELDNEDIELFIQDLRISLEIWHKKIKDRQELRIGLEYSVASLDPRIGGESMSGNILRLLFEGLTRFDQKGNAENAIAQSIEISSNKMQYIFKLRSSFWNDGSPVSAYDFEYAWKKILSPDFKTPFAYLFHPIKNAKEAKEGKVPADQIGIRALNDWTLKVDLERPVNYFLQLTSNPLYSPVHRLIDQKHPEWPYRSEKQYPCNGPFQLKVNLPNQGYQFIKNPFYWEADRIILDQITLTQISPAQVGQAFQKNEIDWIGSPFGNWNPAFIPEKNDRLISIPNMWVSWLIFNTNCFPFNNWKLRQAFAYAIQREQLIKNAFLPLNAAYSPLPPHHGINPLTQFPEEDSIKASQLLMEGLQELGLKKQDLPPLSLTFLERGIREYTANSLKDQITGSLGLDFQLKPLSWSSFFNDMTGGNFQMGITQWISWVDDPVYTLNAFRTADQEVNFSNWENAEFQHWLDLAEQEVNPFQHSSYLRKAEGILCREMPIIPLFYSPSQTMVSKDLHIGNPTIYGCFNITRSYFKKRS